MPTLRSSAALLALAFLSCTSVAAANTTADLSITNPEISGDPYVGTTATYTMQVHNAGPDATEATVTDQLGDAEALVSMTAGQGTCTQSAPAVCSLGTLAPGADVDVTVTVTYTRTSSYNEHVDAVSGPDTNSDPDPTYDRGGMSFEVIDAPAPYVPKPKARTGNATQYAQAHIDVEAELSPYGPGTYYFEYGKTKAYGRKSDVGKVRGQNRTVKGTLDGLAMNTTYHYRVVMIVDGKAYRGRDETEKTFGQQKYLTLTLKATKRGASSTTYAGVIKEAEIADAPGACRGTVEIDIYTSAGADLLQRKTRMRKDCSYEITVPFGTTQARRYGPKGSVIVQAFFSGNRAIAHFGSGPDNP